MTLTWSIEDVNEYEAKCLVGEGDERRLNPVTEALIWHTLSIGINKITEDNAAKVYARVLVIEKLDGASVMVAGEPRPITADDVHDHIGMWTNASSKTDAQFARQAMDSVLLHAERRYKNAYPKEAKV